MRKEYDFSKATRGPVIPQKGKTRISIYIDDKILAEFRNRADAAGRGYQTMINDALREHLGRSQNPLDVKTLRRILREELKNAGQWAPFGRSRRAFSFLGSRVTRMGV